GGQRLSSGCRGGPRRDPPRGTGMTAWQGIRIAVRALRVNMLRSILTMLGIIIGVGAVIAMVAIGSGAQARVTEQIQRLGANLIIRRPGGVKAAGTRLGQGSRKTLTEDDAAALGRELSAVEAAAAYVRGTEQVVSPTQNWSTVIQGVTPDYLEARDWMLVSGRPFSGEDVEGASKVVLIGQTASVNLFGDADPVGQTIRIRNVPFTIVGLLDRKGQTTGGTDQDDVILLPISTAKKKILGVSKSSPRAVDAVVVKIRDGENMEEGES